MATHGFLRSGSDAELTVRLMGVIANSHFRADDNNKAIEWARKATAAAGGILSGLADAQAASVRDNWRNMWETGYAASHNAKRPADAFYFAAAGRAGALLEALGGRERLLDVRVPDALRAELQAARDQFIRVTLGQDAESRDEAAAALENDERVKAWLVANLGLEWFGIKQLRYVVAEVFERLHALKGHLGH